MLPDFDFCKTEGHPYIEIGNNGLLHYVIKERDIELERKIAITINELEYWVFEKITLEIAINFELNNRDETKDSRRIMFAKQIELLSMIDSNWCQKITIEQTKILLRYPYDDFALLRAKYCRELRQEGLTENEINKLASAKYPKMI